MRNLFHKMRERDAAGDSPLEIVAALICFAACMAVLMSLPGH